MPAPPPRLPTAGILLIIAGIYTTQSVIGAITFHGVPAVLRKAGAGLDLIGFMSLFMLPWALKFLWAPAIERLRLPAAGGRRSRQIIVIGQALAMLTISATAGLEPAAVPAALLLALAVVAIVTATVDIACDGFAVEQFTERVRGWGNVMQVGGGYVGAMIGSGLFLVLVDRAGWSTGILAAAALVVALTLPAAVTREPVPDTAGQGTHRPSLADALGRPAIRHGLVAVLLVQAGLRLSQGMGGPFLIDRGFDLQLLGVVSGIAGTGASLVGTLLAGLLLRQLDVAPVLQVTVAAMLVVLAGFVAAALLRDLPWQVLAGLVLAKSLVTGALFVTLYTAMMGWSSQRQAGVDFTLFQCADAAMAAVAGVAGGQLAHHLGYGACFGLAAALALVASLALPVVVRRAAGAEAAS